MTILVIETGLFPDGETVDAALAQIDSEPHRLRLNVSCSEQEFDQAIAAIMAADLVVTT